MSFADAAAVIAADEPPLQAPFNSPSRLPAASVDSLSLLDDPQEWSAFSRPQAKQPGVWDSSLLIEGMHCAACAITLEDALLKVPGVQAAEVSAGSHRARVVWSQAQVLPSGWMQAIQSAGYRAVPANDVFARERRRAEARKALWRLAVAGLCMMQVMMYAYPAYVARPGDLSHEMEQLLRWASWVLSLPVVLFSCGPFFSSAWRDVLHRRISMDLPVAIGMLITFAVSTAGTFEPQGLFGREVYFDSLTMFVFFLLCGRWLELRLRDRTAGALEALMNRLPDSVARLCSDGSYEQVAVRRLVVGDTIRVVAGQSFPADGRVSWGQTLVDEALLTGESHPLPRGVGDKVIAGSHNLSGTVTVSVERVGEQTRFAQIVALMDSASTTKPPLARLADRMAKPFLVAVLVAAAGAGIFWWGQDPEHALMVAVAVLVVTCPCALSLATPAAMLAASGTLARQGVLVRRLDALEALARVDTLLFDKTGTLTTDHMRLIHSVTRPGVTAAQALALAAALAQHSLHPVSRALVRAAQQGGAMTVDVDQVQEVVGQGVSGLLINKEHNSLIRLGSEAFCSINSQSREVLSSPASCVYLADASGWLARFEFEEELRADAVQAVAQLKRAGIAVHLLSGDGHQAVALVAQRAGIDQFAGQCTPQDKLDFMRQRQAQGDHVAVVGDGLNDGPVLAGAQVSFAFGQAVPLAQAKSDFVVLGEQLGVIVRAVLLARQTLRVVRQNLWWAAIYNAVCVPLAILGWIPAWLAGLGMATSSLLVVLNALRLARFSDMGLSSVGKVPLQS